MFSSLISCDDVQQQRLVCASIIVMHYIKLNYQSLQCKFPIINGTKYRLRRCIFGWYKVVENESDLCSEHKSFMNENESVEQWTLMQNQQWGISS